MNLEELEFPEQEVDQLGEKLRAFLVKEDVDIGIGTISMMNVIYNTLVQTSPEVIDEFIKAADAMFAQLKKEHPLKHWGEEMKKPELISDVNEIEMHLLNIIFFSAWERNATFHALTNIQTALFDSTSSEYCSCRLSTEKKRRKKSTRSKK